MSTATEEAFWNSLKQHIKTKNYQPDTWDKKDQVIIYTVGKALSPLLSAYILEDTYQKLQPKQDYKVFAWVMQNKEVYMSEVHST